MVYVLTHVVRLCTGHVLIKCWRRQCWVTGLWLTSCNPRVLSISEGSRRLCTGSPRPTLPLHVVFWLKEHIHREAGVYCFFLVTAAYNLRIQFYSSQKWQATHRPTMRLSLLQRSSFNVQCPVWHRTRHFQSYLLTEDICELAEGSVLCQLLFSQAACYSIIHYQHEVTGHCLSTPNKGSFHSAEL